MRVAHIIHAGINAQYNYYIRSLTDKQKELLCKKDENGDSQLFYYLFSRKEYSDIVKVLNENIGEKITQGNKMNLGRCGDIYIAGARRNVEVNKDGKFIKQCMGVNWKESIELWKELYPDVEQKMKKGANISYKHIKAKPKVYYDNKYQYKLIWNKGRSKLKPTGQPYFNMFTNDNFKKRITKAIGDTEGTQVAAVIYDIKDYRNKRLNDIVKHMYKID